MKFLTSCNQPAPVKNEVALFRIAFAVYSEEVADNILGLALFMCVATRPGYALIISMPLP